MKILMISSYLPYPLFSGGQIRLYNLIKELSGHHEITLICEIRPHQSNDDIREVEKICKKVITVERRKQWTPQNIVKSIASSHSFLVIGHTHQLMQKKIQDELERNKYDVIHVETFYVFQNLSATSLPIILGEHNIEYLVYKRFVDRAPFFLRPFLSLDIAKMKKEETAFWKKATKLIAVSEDDKIVMEEAGLSPSIVPNGVNTNQFTLKDIDKAIKDNEKKILFIGDFKWLQNRDAVRFIIKEIWPRIKKVILSGAKNPKDPSGKPQDDNGVKLWIVGRRIPGSIKSLANDPDIIFDEESSARPALEIFQEAAILLAPIRIGGGTSYKILESMASGTPVVTRKMSAESILAQDNEEIMVGQSAEELAGKSVTLLIDPGLYKKIALNARVLIEKKYTWKKIAKVLESVYEQN